MQSSSSSVRTQVRPVARPHLVEAGARSESFARLVPLRPLPRPSSEVIPASRPRAIGTERDLELALVQRLLDSDPAAWRSFTKSYAPLILGCIRRVLGRFTRVTSEHDVEEVYARFCCDLVSGERTKLRRFDPEKGSRLSTWLGMLATNATYDYLRRIKRERAQEPLPETDTFCSNEPSPDDVASDRERARIAADVLETLSERDREFVELYFGEGVSPEVISERMGISIKTVYTKKHKITARLERLLAVCRA